MVRIDCNIRKKRKEMNLELLEGKRTEGCKMNAKGKKWSETENGKWTTDKELRKKMKEKIRNLRKLYEW